jgi:hypothetical protein
MTTLAKPRELSNRTTRGRAINSIAEFLRSSLTVPNIYIEPSIHPNLDLLAVDRGGAGDLHGVEIDTPRPSLAPRAQLLRPLARLKAHPTHYRYLALPKTESLLRLLPELQLFSPDGIGRTGILLLSEQLDGLPLVELAIKAERYRVPPASMEKIDKFLAKNRPDIEVRI